MRACIWQHQHRNSSRELTKNMTIRQINIDRQRVAFFLRRSHRVLRVRENYQSKINRNANQSTGEWSAKKGPEGAKGNRKRGAKSYSRSYCPRTTCWHLLKSHLYFYCRELPGIKPVANKVMKHDYYTKELNHCPYKPMMVILVVYEVLLRQQPNDDFKRIQSPPSIDHSIFRFARSYGSKSSWNESLINIKTKVQRRIKKDH